MRAARFLAIVGMSCLVTGTAVWAQRQNYKCANQNRLCGTYTLCADSPNSTCNSPFGPMPFNSLQNDPTFGGGCQYTGNDEDYCTDSTYACQNNFYSDLSCGGYTACTNRWTIPRCL